MTCLLETQEKGLACAEALLQSNPSMGDETHHSLHAKLTPVRLHPLTDARFSRSLPETQLPR